MKNLKNSILEALDMNVPEMGQKMTAICDKIAFYCDEDVDDPKGLSKFVKNFCDELDKKVKAPVIKKVFGIKDPQDIDILIEMIGDYTSMIRAQAEGEGDTEDFLAFCEELTEGMDQDEDITDSILDNYPDADEDFEEKISGFAEMIHEKWSDLIRTALKVEWSSY